MGAPPTRSLAARPQPDLPWPAPLPLLPLRGAAVKVASEQDSGATWAEPLWSACQAVLMAALLVGTPDHPLPGLWGGTRSALAVCPVGSGVEGPGWGPGGPCIGVWRAAFWTWSLHDARAVHGHRPPSAAPAVGPGISGWRVLGPPASWEPRGPTLHLHSGQPSWEGGWGPRLRLSTTQVCLVAIQLGGGGCSWGPCMRSGVL